MSAASSGHATAALVAVWPDRAALDVQLQDTSLLRRSVLACRDAGIGQVVVAAPPGLLADCEDALVGLDVRTIALPHGPDPVGQAARTAAAEAAADVVVVHDAARGAIGSDLIAAVLAPLQDGSDACAPIVPVTDTVKQMIDGRILATIDRSTLVSVQTPQAFRVSAIADASDVADQRSALYLSVKGEVRYIPGAPHAQRIPGREAGVLADALLRWRDVTRVR